MGIEESIELNEYHDKIISFCRPYDTIREKMASYNGRKMPYSMTILVKCLYDLSDNKLLERTLHGVISNKDWIHKAPVKLELIRNNCSNDKLNNLEDETVIIWKNIKNQVMLEDMLNLLTALNKK